MSSKVCYVQLHKHKHRQLLIVVSGLVTSLPFHLTKDLMTTLNQHGVENSAFSIIRTLLILTGGLLGTSHLLVFHVICAEMFTSSFRGLVLIWAYVLVQNTVSLNFHTLSFWINWPHFYVLYSDTVVIYPNRSFVNQSIHILSFCTVVLRASH